MPLRNRHPKAAVESALQHAEDNGWVVRTPYGHWGIAWCPGHICFVNVWSSPKNAENHAKQIRRKVERCAHEKAEEEST